MKAKITLLDVKKLDLGTPVAVFELRHNDIRFELQSTGMSLVVVSTHSVRELIILTDWMIAPSNNDEVCRENQYEIIEMAKTLIRTHNDLWATKTL